MKNKGELFVISGPSGVGKGVICKALLLADDKIRFSVSATTRAPRPGEEHGVSYFFVTREEFEGMIQRNELLEYMDVFGMNYYGTPKAYIEKLTSEGIDVILDIDVNGARNVKKQRPEAVSIFILPPSMQALHSRLVGRGTETPEAVEKRFGKAKEEISHANEYDYIVVNDSLEELYGCRIIEGGITTMMNKPSIIDLQKKVKCRYMLVSIVAKRARQLVGQDELLNNQKAVSYAVNELNNDELEITYPEEQ